MKEIKFKAFFKGIMGEPFYPLDGLFLASGGTFHPETIFIQFTGKLGFNNRELYTGDIVFYEEAEPDGDKRYYLVILWIEEWSMFASVFIDEYLKYLDNGAEALDESMFWTYTLQESAHFHYAGNIHEHPHLLKKHG